MSVSIEVLGHLIFYFPAGARDGARAKATVPAGTAIGYLPEMLGIPKVEIQSFVVNGQVVTDPSYVLGRNDTVVVLPVISGG